MSSRSAYQCDEKLPAKLRHWGHEDIKMMGMGSDFTREDLSFTQRIAFDNFNLSKILHSLWRTPSNRRVMRNYIEYGHEFIQLLGAEACRLGAVYPPYFIPVFGLGEKGSILGRVIMPRCEHLLKHGSLYYFNNKYKVEVPAGKLIPAGQYDLWFCTHAFDRLQEHFQLTKAISDVGRWLYFLRCIALSTDDYIEDRGPLVRVCYKYEGKQEPAVCYPVVLDRLASGESILVVKTALVPGMSNAGPPGPLAAEAFRKFLQTLLKRVWDF